MANDSTVKAGSWGRRTVEKILRIQETAQRLRVPAASTWSTRAGARITDQIEMFPGRRGAGRIFYNQVQLCGQVPQICLLFGPSRGRRRVHPGVLRRRRDGRRQREHVPRLAAHGRDGHRREGDARGDGRREDALLGVAAAATCSCKTEDEAIAFAQALPRVHAAELRRTPPPAIARAPAEAERQAARGDHPRRREQVLRHDGRHRRDHRRGQLGSRSRSSSREEIITGFARIDGRAVGIVANQPKWLGRRALRRLRRQGGALHLAVRRVQRPAPLPGRRARAS